MGLQRPCSLKTLPFLPLPSLEHSRKKLISVEVVVLLCLLSVFPSAVPWAIVLGEKENVLGPISQGSTRFDDKFRQASLLQDFSGPFLVSGDFDLLRSGSAVQHFPMGSFWTRGARCGPRRLSAHSGRAGGCE